MGKGRAEAMHMQGILTVLGVVNQSLLSQSLSFELGLNWRVATWPLLVPSTCKKRARACIHL